MTIDELFAHYIGLDQEEERFYFACAFPALISLEWLQGMSQEIARKSASCDVRAERLLELGTFRNLLAKDADLYPGGCGPVELLSQQVLDGRTSLAAAKEIMRGPEMTIHLSSLYAHLLICHAEQRIHSLEERRQAVLWSRLLAEGCLAASVGGAPENLTIAGIGWIQLAGVSLAAVPDGEILVEAKETGLLLLGRLTGEIDRSRRGDVLHALGCLYSDPYSSSGGAGHDQLSYRRWLLRLHKEMSPALAQQHLEEFPLPQAKDALEIALGYFQEAIRFRQGNSRGVSLKAIAQTLLILSRCNNVPVDQPRVTALCLEALDLLQSGSYHHDAVCSMLHSIGSAQPRERDPLSSDQSPDQLLLSLPSLMQKDPEQALATLLKAEDLFALEASDSQKINRFSIILSLIARKYGAGNVDSIKGTSVSEKVESMKYLITGEGWDNDEVAGALLRLAIASRRSDEEDLGLRLLGTALEASPTIAGHQAPIAYLLMELHIGAAVNALNAGHPEQAAEHYGQALAPSVRLDMHTYTLDLLARLGDLAGYPAEEVYMEVLKAVLCMASEIDRRLGDSGAEALQVLYQQMFACGIERGNLGFLCILMQLAKAERFTEALRSGVSYDCRQDQAAAEMIQEMRELEKVAAHPPLSLKWDEMFLISSVGVANPTAGNTAVEALDNIRRAFDIHVRKRLKIPVNTSVIFDEEMIQKALGDTSVLMDYYFAGKGTEYAIYVIIYTSDAAKVFKNVLTDTNEGEIYKAQTASVLINSIGKRTLRIRRALGIDPDPDLLSPEATEALTDDFELLLGSPTWDYLEELRQGGRSHLCICPHSSLHFYPLHLLGPDGRDLARDWTITSISSLAFLFPRVVSPRSSRGRAMGLGYSTGHPLGRLDSAASEVSLIAGVFGTPPLMDGDVTEETVLDALRTARMVHLCAHGKDDPKSPFLHHFVLSPRDGSDGRLCAYEILREDLRGLEVLTLGACGSGLGRFDIADNLTGLPAALFIAGTSSIVTVSWDVSDEAAAVFFPHFYQLLKAGNSRLEAFRGAQLRVRATCPEARDWAVFGFQGRWTKESC